MSADGKPEFGHDVIREYFLARRTAVFLAAQGPSASAIATLNDLAARAETSAVARNVFRLVIQHLDLAAPDLLATTALSPTVSTSSTLPLMISAVPDGAAFAVADVLGAIARRCVQEPNLGLTRALLSAPAVTAAMGAEHGRWLLALLSAFGSSIWTDAARTVELTYDADMVVTLLDAADLDHAESARFFARYLFLFYGDTSGPASLLDRLLGHPDWRVRAALSHGIGAGEPSPPRVTSTILSRLVRDHDYKVRAAAARILTHAEPADGLRHLATLLTDDNWHVRETVLICLLTEEAETVPSALRLGAARVVSENDDWNKCPSHIAPLVERLLLLHSSTPKSPSSRVHARAVFRLLRESRTGSTSLPAGLYAALLSAGQDSPYWLARREAAALADDHPLTGRQHLGAPSRPEEFRRLRGQRRIQIALDVRDTDQAVTVAKAVAEAGLDFVEIGDPLIKQAGIDVIEQVKSEVPDLTVVAEMMSADWGRDQVELAAEAGADVVFLIGPATEASVSAAVLAGRRLGVPIILDVPKLLASPQWVHDMERAGVDGFAITTNIDLGVGGHQPMSGARVLRGWTQLPVAVSGGFSAIDYAPLASGDWDILIVGRAVTEAVNPTVAATRLAQAVSRLAPKEDR